MPDAHRPLSEGKITALKLLMLAYNDAEDVGEEPRQFAVRWDELLARGVLSSDLLWLVKLAYVTHVREVTGRGEARRQFQATGDFVFAPNSCFFLTYAGKVYANGNGIHRPGIAKPDAGAEAERKRPDDDNASRKQIAGRQPEDADADVGEPQASPTSSSPGAQAKPYWNEAEGNLYLGGRVILRLGSNAPAEREVLGAFQFWQWESPVKNPIPRDTNGDPTQARRHAIYNLNRHLCENPPLEFFCLQGDFMGWRAHSSPANLNGRST